MNVAEQGQRRERIHSDGIWRQAHCDMLHDRIAGNGNSGHVCRINASCFAQLGLHLAQRILDDARHQIELSINACRDAADNVASERNLGIWPAHRGKPLACRKVMQMCHDGGGSDVDCHAEAFNTAVERKLLGHAALQDLHSACALDDDLHAIADGRCARQTVVESRVIFDKHLATAALAYAAACRLDVDPLSLQHVEHSLTGLNLDFVMSSCIIDE